MSDPKKQTAPDGANQGQSSTNRIDKLFSAMSDELGITALADKLGITNLLNKLDAKLGEHVEVPDHTLQTPPAAGAAPQGKERKR